MTSLPFKEIFEDNIDCFNEYVMPNKKLSRGIMNSEGFAFCALADYYNVDMVIESGICNGGSTIIWGKWFEEIPIISLDLKVKFEAAVRTCIFKNVLLRQDDGIKIIPRMLEIFSDCRIALFIDGPKNKRAIDLATKCIEYENVKMIGIHDVFEKYYGQPTKCRLIFNNLAIPNTTKFTTDEDWFIDKYGYLDDQDGITFPRTDKYSKYAATVGFILK